MKFATVVVAFVSFCLVSSYSNPASAAIIDAGTPPEPEDAVAVPLEEPDDATAAGAIASVIDAIPEEAMSVPSRRRKLSPKKTGALVAQVTPSATLDAQFGGCPLLFSRKPDYDIECPAGQIMCLEINQLDLYTWLCVPGGDACNAVGIKDNEKACKEIVGCSWYPHYWPEGSTIGRCSSGPGVSCGTHRAPYCSLCPYYEHKKDGKKYCKGSCYWYHPWLTWIYPESCENK